MSEALLTTRACGDLWDDNPLWMSLFRSFSHTPRSSCLAHPGTTIPRLRGSFHYGFNLGLFPVHSPLLGESLLFSFPALSNMLKFSALSCIAEVEENDIYMKFLNLYNT